MGVCKDCAYWKHHFESNTKHWHVCDAVDILEQNQSPAADAFALFAYAHDDCGLTVRLCTGPLFGCLKFKPA